MIYELRTYTLIPGKQGEYLKLNSEGGRPTRGQKYGTLEGSWTTEFGTLNQFVTLWSYTDLIERERLRAELAKNEVWSRD
jgi:NIPSNAP